MHTSDSAGSVRTDAVLAVGLLVGSFAYLHYSWPNSLAGLDEGTFLYEAKRGFEGEVMYRDFFDVVGPASIYAMTLMYALFGASMETARWSMAILHGIIAALVYLIARRLGVRPMLAAAICVTHVALFYPALPWASSHWIATAFTVTVFWLVLRRPVTRPGTAVAAGALTALVALSHQPKGAGTAAAVAVVLIRDAWADPRGRPLLRVVVRQLAAFAIGVLGLVLPTLLGFAYAAGVGPVYEAFVRHPLVAYRGYAFHREGRWWPLLGSDVQELRQLFTIVPSLVWLSLLPLIIPVSAVRLIRHGIAGALADDRRPLFVAVVFSVLSIASVLYQPNHAHFAIVGPVWLSLWAELLERCVRRIERTMRAPLAAPVAALIVLILLTLEMRRSQANAWRGAGVPGETPFGRVHFRSQTAVDEAEAVRAILQAAGAKDVFVYPSPVMYLLTDTSNPTRFQLVLPGYTTAEQYAEVEQTLERERVPFILRTFWFWRDSGDPLQPYIRAHYEGVKLPLKPPALPSLQLFRRKADDGDGKLR